MLNLKSYLYSGLAILILLAIGYVYFIKESRDKYQAKAVYEQSEKEKSIATVNKMIQDAESDRKLLEQYQSTKSEIQYVDKIVTQQVIKYRDVVTTRFIIPNSFVLAYNTSAESMHTEDSAAGTNGASPALAKIVNDADLLEVVTSNNRICVKQAAQLTALQFWTKK